MLDMGFSEDIMTIAKKLPTNRQTIMFSATMPQKIEELAKTLLHNPVEVKIAVSKPAEKIQQSAYVCYEPQKLKIIHMMFKSNDLKRVIIFSGKINKVKEINRELRKMHINSGEMHSDLSQAERDHDAEDYVHRIGRTARAERDGRAITFVNENDIRYFKVIERFLEREIEKNPMPDEFGETPDYDSITIKEKDKKGKKRYYGKRKRDNKKPQGNKKKR